MSLLESDDLMSMSRENSFKKENENLKRDSHEMKQLVTPLDRNVDRVGLERLLSEELLGKEQRKCQRLKEKVIRLTEEKEKLNDHVKTVDKKRDMLFVENLKIENAKNHLISELGNSRRKCQDLEAVVTQLTEEKRMLTNDVKMADEKCNAILMENMKMENEKNNLTYEMAKSGNKCQELEAAVTLLTVEKTMLTDHVKVAEDINLNMENKKNNLISELNEKMNELKNKNLESERLVGVYQEKCRCLDNKIAKMDQEIGQMKSEVEELRLANKAIKDSSLKKTEWDKTTEVYKRMKMIGGTPNIQYSSGSFSYAGTGSTGGTQLDTRRLAQTSQPNMTPMPALMPSYGDSNWGAPPAQGPVMGNMCGPPSENQNHMQPPFVRYFRKGVVCPYNKNGQCRKGLQCDYMHT